MKLETVLNEAKRYKESGTVDWQHYSWLQKKISQLELTSIEYENAISKVCKILNI